MTELSSDCFAPISHICRNLFHLNERFELASMDVSLEAGMGRPTASWVASASHIFTMFDSYTLEWRTLTKAWSAGDYSRLQPYMPCVAFPIAAAVLQMATICSQRELKLTGITSGNTRVANISNLHENRDGVKT